MDIPPKVQIRATIKGGSVFYFIEETFTSAHPHYFVVLNNQPLMDDGLVLVCAISLDLKAIERTERLGYSKETLIDVTNADYKEFSRPTLFDCNSIIVKPIRVFVEKLGNRMLRRHEPISDELLARIRSGVLASKQVSEKVKKLLRDGK